MTIGICLFLVLLADVSHGSRAQVKHERIYRADDKHGSLQSECARFPPLYSLADLRQLLLEGRCAPLRMLAHLLLTYRSSSGWQTRGQSLSLAARSASVNHGRLRPAFVMRQCDDRVQAELEFEWSSRRSWLANVIATASALVAPRALAETKKPWPTDTSALMAPRAATETNKLWPKDGLFPDCPPTDTCVSSQDDRPKNWDNPWVAEGETKEEYKRLKKLIVSKDFGGRIVDTDGERYIRAEFEESGLFGTSIDDAEFFLAPNDTLWQFRAVRLGDARTDNGANKRRLENMRNALGYEKVTVLRNRRRVLIFSESPWDTFGPATYDKD